MFKLYLRVRLPGDELPRHLACSQPQVGDTANVISDTARTELQAFIEGADKFAPAWLPTAEGTWIARAHIIEVTPVYIDTNKSPWKWAEDDDRVLPLSQ